MTYLETAKTSLEAIRRRKGTRHSAGGLLEKIAGWSLGEFSSAGVMIRVYARSLDQDLLLASDNVPEAALVGLELPIYRTATLRKLATLQPYPHSVRRIHDLLTIVQGVITDVRFCP